MTRTCTARLSAALLCGLAFLWSYGCTGCGEYVPQGQRAVDANKPTVMQPVRVIGVEGSAPGQLREPRDLTFDQRGFLHIADFRNYRVQIWDRDLNPVASWGEMGNRDGEFNDPSGIAVSPNGDIVVCDTWNHRVQVFSSEGQHRFTLGGMVAPHAAIVGQDGAIYVADSGKCKIRVFDPDGQPLREWGECGPQRGQMLEPVGLIFGPDGNLWVADNDNSRIQIFSPDGAYVNEIPVVGWVKEGWREPYMALLPDETVVLTVPELHKVLRINASGEVLDNFGGEGHEPGQFRHPTGVAVGPESLVYVIDTWNHRIQVFDLLNGDTTTG